MIASGRVVAFAAVLLTGCAYSAQRVNLKPTPEVASSTVGGGLLVFVNAVDERKSDVLGHRAVGSIGAEITSTEDLGPLIAQSIAEGLQKQGFKPTKQAAAGTPELRVEIRNVDYLVSQGFWSGGLDVDVAMKGICIVGQVRPYENLYRGHYEVRIQVVQSQEANEEYINGALNRALEALLSDAKVTSCLNALRLARYAYGPQSLFVPELESPVGKVAGGG